MYLPRRKNNKRIDRVEVDVAALKAGASGGGAGGGAVDGDGGPAPESHCGDTRVATRFIASIGALTKRLAIRASAAALK